MNFNDAKPTKIGNSLGFIIPKHVGQLDEKKRYNLQIEEVQE